MKITQNKLVRFKKIFIDSFLNFASASIPLFIIQFFIFPQLSINYSSEIYGLILSISSIINITGVSIGSALNNARLINNLKIVNDKSNDDFNRILLRFLGFNAFLTFSFLIIFIVNINLVDLFIISGISIMTLLSNYFTVFYRIKLNFILIFVHNLLYVLGLSIGFLLMRFFNEWLLVFLMGALLPLLFDLYATRFTFKLNLKTIHFQFLMKESVYHFLSTILVSVGVYIDKIILFPFLGGTFVSYYHVSSLIGKTFFLLIGPLSGVFLAYLSRIKQIKKKDFLIILGLTFLISLFSYLFILYISHPFLRLLYPNLYLNSLKYVPLNTLSQLLFISGSLINPVLIRFLKAKFQFLQNLIYATIYICIGLPMIVLYGLEGFIFATILANGLRFVMIIGIYFIYIYKKNKDQYDFN